MQRFVGIFLVTVAAVLLAAPGPVTGATRRIPPLFRESGGFVENPNARFDTRADDDYRLPNTTLPSHYDVELTTNVHDGTKRFTGTVKIDLTIVEATQTIVLHARQLTIGTVTIQTGTSTAETLTHSYEEEREFLTLTRSGTAPFPKDSQWTLTITYEGELRTDNGGFYLSTYTDPEGNEK